MAKARGAPTIGYHKQFPVEAEITGDVEIRYSTDYYDIFVAMLRELQKINKHLESITDLRITDEDTEA